MAVGVAIALPYRQIVGKAIPVTVTAPAANQPFFPPALTTILTYSNVQRRAAGLKIYPPIPFFWL